MGQDLLCPFLRFDAEILQSWPRESLRFGLGEPRAGASLINPADWWQGGKAVCGTCRAFGLGQGTKRLAGAFADGLWPFNERDTYRAGQELMNLTLTTSPALAMVPSTKLPVVGPRLTAAMRRIPYDIGRVQPGWLGRTKALTGRIRISESLVRQALTSERKARVFSRALRHERFYSFYVRRSRGRFAG